ncbi:hypothetical protein [Pararhodobacter sp.]|uniref:hypothetical protein n=1 Tax=Pararhodobacter sp. TaxID=2127056 RepID=UPI002FDDDD75
MTDPRTIPVKEDLFARLTREHAAMREALREIADAAPTCGEESQTTWSNRVWADKFRDLQRIARARLKELADAD